MPKILSQPKKRKKSFGEEVRDYFGMGVKKQKKIKSAEEAKKDIQKAKGLPKRGIGK